MKTRTVRINEADHAALSDLSKASGKPMSAILSEAIRELRRVQFLEQTNEAYAQLRQDPKAWQSEVRERSLWDNTLANAT